MAVVHVRTGDEVMRHDQHDELIADASRRALRFEALEVQAREAGAINVRFYESEAKRWRAIAAQNRADKAKAQA